MDFKTSESVYAPREDSFLLQKEVKRYIKLNKPKRVLDMGTGSGIQAITSKLMGVEEVLAVDINPKAVKLAKRNAKHNKVDIEGYRSDLFSRVKGKFDLIIFNPPYLPVEPPVDVQWSGGKEFIEKFVQQAKLFLTDTGAILFVFSSVDPVRILHKVLAREIMPDGEILYVAKV